MIFIVVFSLLEGTSKFKVLFISVLITVYKGRSWPSRTKMLSEISLYYKKTFKRNVLHFVWILPRKKKKEAQVKSLKCFCFWIGCLATWWWEDKKSQVYLKRLTKCPLIEQKQTRCLPKDSWKCRYTEKFSYFQPLTYTESFVQEVLSFQYL